MLDANSDNVTDDEEYVLLFDLNTSKKPDIKYWKYHSFDLNSYGDDDDDDDVLAQF